MQSQDTYRGGREAGHLVVRSGIAPAWLRILERERGGSDDPTVAAEQDALLDRLISAIEAGEPIDFAEPRSHAAAAWDGESPTTAGYLLGIVRYAACEQWAAQCGNSNLETWQEFIALGSLAADVEAAMVAQA